MCEERQSAQMEKFGGGFWEKGIQAVDVSVSSSDQFEHREGEEEQKWVESVAQTLEALKDVAVVEGLG
ncbi:hypothetical protein H0H93_005713, partial [Arthromyces matolae]